MIDKKRLTHLLDPKGHSELLDSRHRIPKYIQNRNWNPKHRKLRTESVKFREQSKKEDEKKIDTHKMLQKTRQGKCWTSFCETDI